MRAGFFWMECSFPASTGCKSAAVSCSSFFCSKLPCARRKSCLWGIAPRGFCRGSAGGYPLLFAAAANPAAIHQNPGGCRRRCRNCYLAKLLPESKSQCCAGGRAAWPAGGWLCHLAAWAARGYTGGKACIPGAGYVPGAPGVPAAVPRRRNLLPESIPPKPSARPAAMPNE